MKLLPLSLTHRLALLFMGTSTLVLVTLGLIIAAAVEQHFEEIDLDALHGKLELTRNALAQVHGSTDAQRLPDLLRQALVGHHGLDVLVLDAQGRPIYGATEGVFAPAVLSQGAHQPPYPALRWSMGEQPYRGLVAALPTGLADGTGVLQWTVAVALNTTHHDVFMQAFRRTLWWFVLGAAVCSGALGWWVARRGLAPLAAMGAQAHGLTARQLDRRLPVTAMPPELAELAHALNAMLARLEDAFQRLSDFASDLAHELRSPVSNLLMQTQVALAQPRDTDEYRAVLESNVEELERMGRMIADMLLLAQADHGLSLPRREPVALQPEVASLCEFYDALAEERHLTFEQTGNATLQADRLMLRRALANLVSNAVRHADSGSAIQIALREDDSGVRIEVTNQGEPIAPEHLPRLFDRFFRVDPARQRSEGTGLGLAITRSIVAAHGGSIAARCSGRNVTFSIHIPATAQP